MVVGFRYTYKPGNTRGGLKDFFTMSLASEIQDLYSSSQDNNLRILAKQHRPFVGSTFFLTGRAHFLVSGDRAIDTSPLSRVFTHEPVSVILDYNDGVWSIESDEANVIAKKKVFDGDGAGSFLTISRIFSVGSYHCQRTIMIHGRECTAMPWSSNGHEEYSDSFGMRSQLRYMDSTAHAYILTLLTVLSPFVLPESISLQSPCTGTWFYVVPTVVAPFVTCYCSPHGFDAHTVCRIGTGRYLKNLVIRIDPVVGDEKLDTGEDVNVCGTKGCRSGVALDEVGKLGRSIVLECIGHGRGEQQGEYPQTKTICELVGSPVFGLVECLRESYTPGKWNGNFV
ncbi:hypothetical protein EDD15DRAFT_2197194 [Pisolithus albus]|nr:hypothetical protein EDD15DRAFT_2197194 [Pisolithus albus]